LHFEFNCNHVFTVRPSQFPHTTSAFGPPFAAIPAPVAGTHPGSYSHGCAA